MSTGARPGLIPSASPREEQRLGGKVSREAPARRVIATLRALQAARLFLAAENRLMREVLARKLANRKEFEIVGLGAGNADLAGELLAARAEILVLSSRGDLTADLTLIRAIRVRAPEVRILLIGMRGGDMEFLQCVRAGVNGYLPRDASSEEVLEGLRRVRDGGAACSHELCLLLFRYFEREAVTLPSASIHERLGFTRREQQIIALLAQGLSNKEIASQFCLSEQTVKNHLYRMKQKSGADGRMGIVRQCRTQGFFV
ncbi:MAG: response regulator transcription factor [Acidobacteriia bacterium]|nr:response regulator transcription factor [Terriglobia bacterium]